MGMILCEMLDLAIFDMGGTTLADEGQVVQAFTAALADRQITVTPEQLHAVRGCSKRQAMFQLIPEGPDRKQTAAAAYRCFLEELAAQYETRGVQAIPGAEEVFQWLRQRGVAVALNTGFDRSMADLLLGRLGWNDRLLDAVVCGEEVLQGRPAPYLIFHAMEATGASSVHRVACLGDTSQDLWASYHAGVRWNIGVLSGAHSRAILEKVPHTHLISSVAELPQLWGADNQ